MPVRFPRAGRSLANASDSMAASSDLRLVCVQLMHTLHTNGGSLTRLLPEAQARVTDSEQAQLQAWIYGFCRFAGELAGLVDQLLDKPLKRKDLDVYLLMQLGLFQLRHTAVQPHAAVDETVKVTKRLKKPWARGLVNAVLRNYQRQRDELQSRLSQPAAWNHPEWLLSRIQVDWPDNWQAICQANNTQAPMTLRVNRRQVSVEQYLERLRAQNQDAIQIAGAPDALQLTSPAAVSQLPGFNQGHVSVQDAAAQLAASLLVQHTEQGGRLLDACSAPGGKTAHAMESQHFSSVVALDQDAIRLQRVSETLTRLGLLPEAYLQAVDAATLSDWWDNTPFEAILLDAPCSGTGVIRRHPDIKLLRRDSDIDTLVQVQAQLLDTLWTTLAPDGLLLYATCSILKSENEQQINAFIKRTPTASLVAETQQIFPGENGMDGFFYAPLIKQAS